MALFRSAAPPLGRSAHWEFSGSTDRNLRTLSHMSLLVFAAAAVAMSILAGISLSSKFGIGLSGSFILVAIFFPLLCGLLAKEVWHTKKLEARIKRQEATLGIMGGALRCGDNTPAGFLIVSQDMRVQFANQKYMDSTLQEPEEVLGWKIKDVLAAETLEDEIDALLRCSDPAASCCFDTSIRSELAGERPVHITLARIAPRQGQSRVLVIVEDLLPGSAVRVAEPVEGYVC